MPPRGSSDGSPRGKQIVFMFMAGTVVSVVVFLCGVLVGRGVPDGAALANPDGAASIYDLPPATLTTPSAEPSAGAAVSHDLSYPQRLLDALSAGEPVRASAQSEESAAAVAPSEPVRPPPAPVAVPATVPASAEDGYAVQVSASRGVASAQAVAYQLRARGFPVFVLDPFPDDPVRFHRVRVGPYGTRAEADRVRAQLAEREGMSAAYITR